jgi:hypothetical protein
VYKSIEHELIAPRGPRKRQRAVVCSKDRLQINNWNVVENQFSDHKKDPEAAHAASAKEKRAASAAHGL